MNTSELALAEHLRALLAQGGTFTAQQLQAATGKSQPSISLALAKLGAVGYDMLIIINAIVNWILKRRSPSGWHCSINSWHYWLTTYDREFGKYSPGNILLLKMAEHAPTIGIRKIDLGRGEARYKQQLANDVVLVGEGAVDAHGIFRVARRTIFQGAQLLRRSEPVHAVGSWCRRQLRVLKNRRAEGVSGT